MKKFVWFIILILLVATFSDHPRIKPYKERLYATFSTTAQKAGHAQGEQVLRTISKRFAEFSSELGQKQQDELQRITSSKTELLAFNRSYCKEGQFNPLFFGETQQRICRIIADYERGL